MVGKFGCDIAQYRTAGERASCLLPLSSSTLLIFDFVIMTTVVGFNLGYAILADVAQFHIEGPEQSG
jgi:hypothetical protein